MKRPMLNPVIVAVIGGKIQRGPVAFDAAVDHVQPERCECRGDSV